jgi:dihydroxycyclohexadiene carboxylate dehydrogenase
MSTVSSLARFSGKTAIVTGAAQGIGKAVALRMAREGASVVVADLNERYCREVAEEILAAGGLAQAYIADLETAAGARGLVEYAIQSLGRIDMAVHNVGGTIWAKPFWEYEDDQIEKEVGRSLWPVLWACRAVIPHMLGRKTGNIVNIGSVAVRSIYRVPYAASKAGVHAITECMALELADSGVRVNCVAPGGVDGGTRHIPRNPNPLSVHEMELKKNMTAQTIATTPMARYGTVDEIASAVCYLACDEASYITGQVLYVAGGARG